MRRSGDGLVLCDDAIVPVRDLRGDRFETQRGLRGLLDLIVFRVHVVAGHFGRARFGQDGAGSDRRGHGAGDNSWGSFGTGSGLAVMAATVANLGQLLLEPISHPHLGMTTAVLALIVRRGGALAEGVWLVVNAAALGLASVHALVVDHALLEGHTSIGVQAHQDQMHARDAGLLVVAMRCAAAAAGTATAR